MPWIGLSMLGPLTLVQRILAALLALLLMFSASAILWVYWDLAVR
jgi:hypothetical protein